MGKERSKETKWSYERVEKQRVSLDVRGMLFEEIDVEVTVSLWFWLFRGEAWMSPENVAQR